MSTGSCENTEVPLTRLWVGGGEEEGVSGRASWRRYWLSGTLRGKAQGQVRGRGITWATARKPEILEGRFREIAEG